MRPLGQASFPTPSPSNHVPMNENTQLGLPVPERVRKRHMYVYSQTGITRARHGAVQMREAMTDPGPEEAQLTPKQSQPALPVGFQYLPLSQTKTALRNFKNRLRRGQQPLLSPIPAPTQQPGHPEAAPPGPQGPGTSGAGMAGL